MANSEDPDEMAPYEQSHQDLQCLQKIVLVCRAERVIPTAQKAEKSDLPSCKMIL